MTRMPTVPYGTYRPLNTAKSIRALERIDVGMADECALDMKRRREAGSYSFGFSPRD